MFTAPANWRVELRAKIGHHRNRCLIKLQSWVIWCHIPVSPQPYLWHHITHWLGICQSGSKHWYLIVPKHNISKVRITIFSSRADLRVGVTARSLDRPLVDLVGVLGFFSDLLGVAALVWRVADRPRLRLLLLLWLLERLFLSFVDLDDDLWPYLYEKFQFLDLPLFRKYIFERAQSILRCLAGSWI